MRDSEAMTKEFMVRAFALGRQASEIGPLLQDGGVVFPPSSDLETEFSLAVLGASLALLRSGHTLVMSCACGETIEARCKQMISGYDQSGRDASWMIEAVDDYEHAVEVALQSGSNPFAEASGVMLIRTLGRDVMSVCVPGTDTLNPFVHEVVGDLLTLSVTEALSCWKER